MNVAASVRARLWNIARKQNEDVQLVLTRYVIERFLYRLSVSPYRNEFVLKGAMLFQLWTNSPHRATRDLDLLGKGDKSVERLIEVIKAVSAFPVQDDGLTFNPETVSAERIKEGEEYEGVRVISVVRLGGARVKLQIDVGFGDAITPRAVKVQYPTLLDFPAPNLAAYPKPTTIAEKFQSMAVLGISNSRLKDFYDVCVLSQQNDFKGTEIAPAIKATFRRRKTPLPVEPPLALTSDFGADSEKIKQWEAFIRKGKLDAGGLTLEQVCAILNGFLMPPAKALAAGETFTLNWPAGGPWS